MYLQFSCAPSGVKDGGGNKQGKIIAEKLEITRGSTRKRRVRLK
jgi:hypothetical protein